jgi:predicted DNA-binding transcriptional regulator YafY
MQKTERLVAITLLLQSRGKMTADRLADILDVSVRTIYRDMDVLSLAHVPVSMDYGPGGGYFLPGDYQIERASFTSEEAVALALGGSIAGGSQLFESGDGLRRALFKLEATLPDEYREEVRAARERILFDTTPWHHHSRSAEHLETVRSAVWGARQLDLFYPRSGATGLEWRRVEPHGLVCKAGVWYLVAYCRKRRDFRTFRVDRMREVEVREETTVPRPDFDLETYWERARRSFEQQSMPFVLTLLVGESALPNIHHEGQILEHRPDGSAVVRVNLESASTAIQYALWVGPGATVLDPPEVAEGVKDTARSIVRLYELQPVS